jgi:tight adherence protein B
MLAVAATLLFFLMSGVTLAGALVLTRRYRLDLDHRVMLVATPSKVRSGETAAIAQREKARELDERMRRLFTFGLARTWGMTTGARGLIVIAGASAAIGWLLIRVALGFPVYLAVPLIAVVAVMIPRAVILRQQKRADGEFSDLFPDTVVAIARMLRAGLPVTTAVRAISRESAPLIKKVFGMIADQIEIGAPIEDALEVSSEHVGLADFRFFTVAVVLQHATGGNLAATLEILADIVRRRRAIRLKAYATTAEIRATAYVLGALPLLIIAALLVIQPGYLTPLVSDPRGRIILTIGCGLLLTAWTTIRQMMRSVTNV